jgi:hypothetical protein
MLFLACKVQAADAVTTPDFSGVWTHSRNTAPNHGDGEFRTAFSYASDGTPPPLQPWAADFLKEHLDAMHAGKQITNSVIACKPFGLPTFMHQPYPYRIVQTDDVIVIMAEANWDVRLIYMNQKHPPNLKPSWYGNSVGHWEGDTLVVDTVGQNDKSLFAALGIPKTEALHLIERLRLINGGKRLEDRITVDDPGVFTKPWETLWVWDARSDIQLLEYICAENERDAQRLPEEKDGLGKKK